MQQVLMRHSDRILLIVNFIAALLIAHRGDTFVGMFQALTMLFAGLLILLDGPGKFSVDAKIVH